MQEQETNTNINDLTESSSNSAFSGEIVVNKSTSINSLEEFEKEVSKLEKLEEKNKPKEEVSEQTPEVKAETPKEEVSEQTPEVKAETSSESNTDFVELDDKSNVNSEQSNVEIVDLSNSDESKTNEQSGFNSNIELGNIDNELMEKAISSSETDNASLVNDDNKMASLMNSIISDHALMDENPETNNENNPDNSSIESSETPSNPDEEANKKEEKDSKEETSEKKETGTTQDDAPMAKDEATDEKKEDMDSLEDVAKITKTKSEKKNQIVAKSIKNYISKIEKLKRMEIQDVLDILYCGKKCTGIEKKIVSSFIDEYMELKYFNKNEFKGYDYFCSNIRVRLLDYAKKIYNEAKSLEERNIIIRVTDIFLILNLLDSEDKFDINTRMLESKRISFTNKVLVIKDVLKIFKYYDALYQGFLKKLKSNIFTLSLKQIDRDVELYSTNVSSNIQFNEVFNRDVIAKAYNEEVTLENMREVQLRLLSARIADEMLYLNHGKYYIISFPDSVYDKEKKLKSFLSCMNDIYSQSKIYIAITPELLNKKYKLITSLKKEGYRFVIELYSSYLDVIKDLKLLFAVCDYVVIIGIVKNKKELASVLPSYLVNKVLYSDFSIHSGVIC